MPPKTIKAVELTRHIRDVHYEQLKMHHLKNKLRSIKKRRVRFINSTVCRSQHLRRT